MSACNFHLQRNRPGIGLISRLCKPGSCFKSGTQILLADGTRKVIDDIAPHIPGQTTQGDILATASGKFGYVIGVAHSMADDNWPIIRIETTSESAGKESINTTFVTHNHAMCRSNGHLVPAGMLRIGDKLAAEDYEATITSVEHNVDNTDAVWNLWVAPIDYINNEFASFAKKTELFHQMLFNSFRHSLFGGTPKDHQIFADGLLSGDFSIQNQLQQLLRAGIPPERLS